MSRSDQSRLGADRVTLLFASAQSERVRRDRAPRPCAATVLFVAALFDRTADTAREVVVDPSA